MKASSSEGNYRAILDQQNAIIQVGIVPGHQKRTLKVGKLNSIAPQLPGKQPHPWQDWSSFSLFVLTLWKPVAKVLATATGNGMCRLSRMDISSSKRHSILYSYLKRKRRYFYNLLDTIYLLTRYLGRLCFQPFLRLSGTTGLSSVWPMKRGQKYITRFLAGP